MPERSRARFLVTSFGSCGPTLSPPRATTASVSPLSTWGTGVPGRDSTESPAYPLASLFSLGVQVSTPRAWGLCPVLTTGGALPGFVSLLWRCPDHGAVSRRLRHPQSCSFPPTHRTSYATMASARPPERLRHQTGGNPHHSCPSFNCLLRLVSSSAASSAATMPKSVSRYSPCAVRLELG